MKKVTYIFICIIFASCASSKLAMVPVGQWDYTISGTPNGNFSGVFTVSMDNDKYSANLKSQAGEFNFAETIYNASTKKLTGNFDFDGNYIYFESITEGDGMNGTVSAGGSSWPFKASRKK